MNCQEYIQIISQRLQSGFTTEHSFRGDLQQLIEAILPTIRVINEPKRGTSGAPDYILMHPRENLVLGYIEAKDIGKDIANKIYSEQFKRYKIGLNNLIITDYLTFEFYYEGNLYDKVVLGSIISGKIYASSVDEHEKFRLLMHTFISKSVQTINSSEILAKIMANKSKLLSNEILNAVNDDIYAENLTDLTAMLNSFREFLIHDLDSQSFSDIYAQTIVYGMFAARYNDSSLESFSRYEAASLIPHSNPFLRKLFGAIAGIDLDPRISWIVDDLVVVFRYTNVKNLMTNYGRNTSMNDPIIHFYETFLAEYDPKLRKTRGVWYTPQPVVSFIVSSVDQILKDKFDIIDGLSDSQKQEYVFNTYKIDKRTKKGVGKKLKEFHRVQILDPATGTGTFLNEVIKLIHERFKGMEGLWDQYVVEDLIPRLNGFELLMASYTMAHLTLDMLLTKTGFNQKNLAKRFNIYLTNSLEEHDKDIGTIFSSWLSEESREASRIKKDTPVMVILGNPPYSGESANKGKWIMSLMEDYKKEPEGKDKLQEKNSKWINDDYVKFIRYGQYFIEKQGAGVVAFITPHGFLDNPTFRGMRWSLLKTYDEIYVVDLHGNSNKQEVSPDGTPDANVFDIQQGVAISFFIKTERRKSNSLGKVFHVDLYGNRNHKYTILNTKKLHELSFQEIVLKSPNYLFVPQKISNTDIFNDAYDSYISLDKLFIEHSPGVVTSRDGLVIDCNKEKLKKRLLDFYNLELSDDYISSKYDIKNNSSWMLSSVRQRFAFDEKNIQVIQTYPFDYKFIYYSDELIERSRSKIMSYIRSNNRNYFLVVPRQSSKEWRHAFVSQNISLFNLTGNSATNGAGQFFPLYIYPTNPASSQRIPNFDHDMIEKFCNHLDLHFVSEPEEKSIISNSVAPIDIFDYIYAKMYSPNYREKYNELLKRDYPKIPFPKDKDDFWRLVSIGEKLRCAHLLDIPLSEKLMISYPKVGSNIITRKIVSADFEKTHNNMGRIWINDEQYFDNIPTVVWDFYIGGYQPARKWLKDRASSQLTLDDVRHYFKIINALVKTYNLMIQIDKA